MFIIQDNKLKIVKYIIFNFYMLKYKFQSIKPLNKFNNYIGDLKNYALKSTHESIKKQEEYYKNNKYQILLHNNLHNNLYINKITDPYNLTITTFWVLSISSIVTYYFIKNNVF